VGRPIQRQLLDLENDLRELKEKRWRQKANNRGKMGFCFKVAHGS
jgi:hypothetical protein